MTLASQFAAIDPEIIDNIDMDLSFDEISSLLNNSPKLIRSPAALAAIRKKREQNKQDQAMAQKADIAQKLAAGAKNLGEANLGGGGNLLTRLTGQSQ